MVSETELITVDGEIQLMPRKWYHIFKRGWYKHSGLYGELWWIRFNWESNKINIKEK
jgi:hypothetical protein